MWASERTAQRGEDVVEYRLPVLGGRYRVRLLLAELFDGATNVGDRLFDIEVNGATVASGFDTVAEYGKLACSLGCCAAVSINVH